MINASFYIFGNFGVGYTQYPNDYTADLFQKFSTIRPDHDRIIVYRKENLVYHCIIYEVPKLSELSKKVYLGFCVVTNGIRFSDSYSLHYVFESLLTHFLERKHVMFLNTSQDRICTEKESLEKFLRPQLAIIDDVQLSPMSFSTQNGTTRIVDTINKSTELNNEDALVIPFNHKFFQSYSPSDDTKQNIKKGRKSDTEFPFFVFCLAALGAAVTFMLVLLFSGPHHSGNNWTDTTAAESAAVEVIAPADDTPPIGYYNYSNYETSYNDYETDDNDYETDDNDYESEDYIY